MQTLKTYIKYVLYIFGIRSTIPAGIINQKKVCECREALINLKEIRGLFFNEQLSGRVLIRSGVASKIRAANNDLPVGIHIKILSAYRPPKEQQSLYNSYYKKVQKEYPKLSKTDWERMTKAVYANPKNGGGGHQTGGAIDLTLCDAKGQNLAMGTKYLEMNCDTKTNASGLSKEIQKRRKLLCDAMAKQGMQNYPNECGPPISTKNMRYMILCLMMDRI